MDRARARSADATWMTDFLQERLLQEHSKAAADVKTARRTGNVAVLSAAERWLAEVDRQREALGRVIHVLNDGAVSERRGGREFSAGAQAAALAWLEPIAERYSDSDYYPPKVVVKRRSRRLWAQ